MELKGHRKEVARKEIGATGKYRESSEKGPSGQIAELHAFHKGCL